MGSRTEEAIVVGHSHLQRQGSSLHCSNQIIHGLVTDNIPPVLTVGMLLSSFLHLTVQTLGDSSISDNVTHFVNTSHL